MDDRIRALAEATVEIPDGGTLDDFIRSLLEGVKPLALNFAFDETFAPADQVRFGCWPDAIFADRVILDVWRSARPSESRGESKLVSVPYTSTTEGFTFGDPVEVKANFTVNFEPVGEASTSPLQILRAALGGNGSAVATMRKVYAEGIQKAIALVAKGDFSDADALLAEVSGWHPEAHKLGEAISRARRG